MRLSHVWRVLSAVPKLIPWSHYQTARRTATNVRHHHGYLILAVFILLLIPSPLFAQQPQYKVIQIPVQLRLSGVGLKPAIAGRVKTGQVFLPASS